MRVRKIQRGANTRVRAHARVWGGTRGSGGTRMREEGRSMPVLKTEGGGGGRGRGGHRRGRVGKRREEGTSKHGGRMKKLHRAAQSKEMGGIEKGAGKNRGLGSHGKTTVHRAAQSKEMGGGDPGEMGAVRRRQGGNKRDTGRGAMGRKREGRRRKQRSKATSLFRDAG